MQEWEERVHESGATVEDVADLEKTLKRAIILRDIAGEVIYNSGRDGTVGHRPIDIICHNGHAWSKGLHFPQTREDHLYEGEVWQEIREATYGEPLAVWLLGGGAHSLFARGRVLSLGHPSPMA